MRLLWDPNPTFTNLPAFQLNPSQAEVDAFIARMRQLYGRYAASLDQTYPLWHFEILTVRNPPAELAEMAQQRRDREVTQ